MKVSEALFDERIADTTTVIIRDSRSREKARGRWFQDRITVWADYEVSFKFDAEKNIAILKLV